MSKSLLPSILDHIASLDLQPSDIRKFILPKTRQIFASAEMAHALVLRIADDETPNDHASFLLGVLLDEARIGMENDSAHAASFLKNITLAINAGLVANAFDESALVPFGILFRRAGLNLPDELRVEPEMSDEMAQHAGANLQEDLKKIVKHVRDEGGSAIDLYEMIDEMLASLPQNTIAAIIQEITLAKDPYFERCALYMLLSGTDTVQHAVLKSLGLRLARSEMSREGMALLPIIRGWFAQGRVRDALDALIKKTRAKAMAIEQRGANAIKIQKIYATTSDGVGAQSFAIDIKDGKSNVLAMVLVKAGHGIKDAFLLPMRTRREINAVLKQIKSESGGNEISLQTLTLMIEGALADGFENARLPAPGFLDVIEAGRFLQMRPQKMDADKLFDLVDPSGEIRNAGAQKRGRWIKNQDALIELLPISESWFEDSAATREIFENSRTKKIMKDKLWAYLETRRDYWIIGFLRTAAILNDGGNKLVWETLVATAWGLHQGRSLKSTPLMQQIIDDTIDAAMDT